MGLVFTILFMGPDGVRALAESTESFTMYSDDESVAVIDNDGNVTAVGVGVTTVHAHSDSAFAGSEDASCVVRVTADDVARSESVTKTGDFSYDVVLVKRGKVTIPEIAKVKGSKDKWAVVYSEKRIATVTNSGKITGLKDGSLVATVKYGEKIYTLNIKVTTAAFEKKTFYVNEGDTVDASLQNTSLRAAYVSSKPGVAAVSGDGTVSASACGSTRITASLCGLKMNCTVVVENPSFKYQEVNVKAGKTFRQKLLGTKGKNVSWSSDDTSVATVSSKGVIKAVGAGATTVHAIVNGRDLTCQVTVE